MKFFLLFGQFLLFVATPLGAAENIKTISLQMDYKVMECSHDPIFLYPCSLIILKSESIDFVLDSCMDYSNGTFCDSRVDLGTHKVAGFKFSAIVLVQSFVEKNGASETTIHGFMKSGDVPDLGETNFSLFIDSGVLRDPVRVAGVTLAVPADAQQKIYTYTPQLKISPVVDQRQLN